MCYFLIRILVISIFNFEILNIFKLIFWKIKLKKKLRGNLRYCIIEEIWEICCYFLYNFLNVFLKCCWVNVVLNIVWLNCFGNFYLKVWGNFNIKFKVDFYVEYDIMKFGNFLSWF